MNDTMITVIAEMDIMNDNFAYNGTEFVFFKRHGNAMNYVFDDYFNSDEWEVDESDQRGVNEQIIFSFKNKKFPNNFRMLIIEKLDMDSQEMEMITDVISFED